MNNVDLVAVSEAGPGLVLDLAAPGIDLDQSLVHHLTVLGKRQGIFESVSKKHYAGQAGSQRRKFPPIIKTQTMC